MSKPANPAPTGKLLLKIDSTASGWVLVDAHLDRPRRPLASTLLVEHGGGGASEVMLPIRPDGRVHELIKLPADVSGLTWRLPEDAGLGEPVLHIRNVGWIERTVRMAHRVARLYMRLSVHERRECGLSPWAAIADLARAYGVASEFRIHYTMEQYGHWISRFDTLSEDDRDRIRRHIARLPCRPRIRILVAAADSEPAAVRTTLDSIAKNLYPDHVCTVLGGSRGAAYAQANVVPLDELATWLMSFNASLSAGDAWDWIMLVKAGDRLPEHGLYWFACEALAATEAVVIYADDDCIDATGARATPRFKPDWSVAHLRATDYIGSAAVLRGTAVRAAGGLTPDCARHGNFDLLLRVVDVSGGQIAHVPAVLLHRQSDAGRESRSSRWQDAALEAHLARNGTAAAVEDTHPGCRRIRFRLPPDSPVVSIIVPTRDRVELLRPCVESVLAKTRYPAFELLIVDNQSAESDALAYLHDIGKRQHVHVLRYNRPFNYSALNNFAVRQARGAALCLLNNDTEIISPDWLDEMVGHLLQPRVGAVGAKLYYGDGRVQHAGDVVGPGGCANHLHSGIAHDDPGYCNRAVVAQDLSAVTAACMLTWKDRYEALGGLDEEHLSVAFNDVDYCLRLRAAGLRVVWTPHAELYHHESVSRGADLSVRRKLRARREVAFMRNRWMGVMWRDPFYNPNLSYQHPDFSLSRAPRVVRPWLT